MAMLCMRGWICSLGSAAILIVSVIYVSQVDGACGASTMPLAVELPPILAACATPLRPSEAARWVEQLSSGGGLGDVPAFCDEAGLVCDQGIHASPVVLYTLSTYRRRAASDTKAKHNMFFGERRLFVGSSIRLPDPHEPIPTRAFLPPRLEAQLFNATTIELQQALQLFGFHDGSPMAASMQMTLQLCKAPPQRNETKACVASFETMLGFAVSLIGAADMEVLAGSLLPAERSVTVKGIDEMTGVGERGAVACHNAMFPYQVFYCHNIRGTKVFKATLQTHGKLNISAVASCHQLGALPSIFAGLKLQHGELVCHWNYGDNIVWIPKPTNKAALISST